MADDEKTPIEQALDLFLYAPIGFALVARDNLPSIIDRGREQVNQQVTLARMLGQFAVQQGEKELRKRFETRPPAPPKPAPPKPPVQQRPQQPASTNGQAAKPADAPTAPPSPPPAPTPPSAAEQAGPAKSAAHLAIPAYDTLSASQVVQRLAGLASDELEAVRDYEASTRGRRTILTKISQLQAS